MYTLEESNKIKREAAYDAVSGLKKIVSKCDPLSTFAVFDAMDAVGTCTYAMTAGEINELRREIGDLASQFNKDCVCRNK